MGGTEAESKRKRKRKTRSERNQLAHHLISSMDEGQERIKCGPQTKGKISNCVTYSLRSGKTVPCPMEIRKTNGVSITSGRLTRKVGILGNIQTSDWISRGPTSEFKDVGENRDKRTEKNVLNPISERTKGIQDIDPAGDRSSTKVNYGPQSLSADEQDINLIGQVSCPNQDNLPASSSNKQKQKPSFGSVMDKTASVDSSKSSNMDEYLDHVLPYQEISENIGRDIKLKMMRIYPSRNLEMEICSNLQKLLKNSSQRIRDLDNTMYEDISGKNRKCLSETCEESRSPKLDKFFQFTPSSSTSICPAALPQKLCASTQLGETFSTQDCPSYVTHISYAPHVSPRLQEPINPYSHLITNDALDDNCSFHSSSSKTEKAPPKPMDIHIPKNEESEEEEASALPLACYHAFLVSSLELSALQKKQQESMKIKVSERAKSLTESSVRKGIYPYCISKTHHNNHHDHHTYRGNEHDYNVTSSPPTHHAKGKCLSHHYKVKDTRGPPLSHLDISRHRLKTALESASARCQKTQSLNSLLNPSGLNGPNGLIFQDTNQSLPLPHQTDACMNCSCPGPSLGQMKTHQTDLQYQAKDFLDELEQEFNQSHASSSTERYSLLSDPAIHGRQRPARVGFCL